MFAPTSPLILRRKPITKQKAKRRKRLSQRTRSRQSQTEADDSDSIPIQPGGLSLNEPIAIAHQKSEELYVQSTIFQSNSWSERNESVRNMSITRRNRFLSRRRTKQSTAERNNTGNSRHSSLRVSEASHGNERNTGDKVGLDPSASRIKDVVDSPIVSGGGASTSDDGESRKVLIVEKEGKAQTRFVRVPSVS
jgi:hypothetical protein